MIQSYGEWKLKGFQEVIYHWKELL